MGSGGELNYDGREKVMAGPWLDNVRTNLANHKFMNPLDRELTPFIGKYVIVGAGPSLDTTKHLLPMRKAEGKTIICMIRAMACIDGIVSPDVVVALDDVTIFDDYCKYANANTALVCSLMVSPKLVDNWPGPLYGTLPLCDEQFDAEIEELSEKYRLPRIGAFLHSVGFTLFILRCLDDRVDYMGCDYSYYPDKYYAEPYTDKPPTDIPAEVDKRYIDGRLTNARFLDQIRALSCIEMFYMLNKDRLEELLIKV